MKALKEDVLGLMPGKARPHWKIDKSQKTEDIAGAPGGFAVSDDLSDEEMQDLLKRTHNPTWTYPDWVLKKQDLNETPEFEVQPGFSFGRRKVRVGIKWYDGEIQSYCREAASPQEAAIKSAELKTALKVVKTGRQLGEVMDSYGWLWAE